MKADFIPAKPDRGNLRPREVTHLMQDHTTKKSTGPKIYRTFKSSTHPKKLLAPGSHVPTLAGIEVSKNGKVLGVGSSSEESWGKIQKTVYADVAFPSPNAEVSQKCISQNTNVAKCSMKKDFVVKSVQETLHSESTPVKSQSTLAY